MVALVEVGVFTPVDWSGCSKSETTIPTRDGAALRTIVYKPDDRAAGKYHGAVFVYFHGGGWTFGFPEAGESYFESLVKDLGITCVSVGYRLAPENRFPTAVEDAIDAVKWVMANGTSIGGDVSIGLVLSGSSAGGLLAAVVSHVAVDEGWTPALSGLVLLNPGLCHPNAVPVELKEHYKSWEECKDGVILDQRGMKFFYGAPLSAVRFSETDEQQSNINLT